MKITLIQILTLTFALTYGLLVSLSYRKTLKKKKRLSKLLSLLIWGWFIFLFIAEIIISPSVDFDIWYLWVGIMFIFAGILIGFWGIIEFRSISRLSGLQEDNLIKTGPYKYIRNPQYLGTFIALIGCSFFASELAEILIGLGIPIISIACILIWLGAEEERLLDIFGEKYKKYMETTPRFFPYLIRRNKR